MAKFICSWLYIQGFINILPVIYLSIKMTNYITFFLFERFRTTKIIHQTWKSHSIAKDHVPWIRSWVVNHPDWEYWFWTDEDARKMVEMEFPHILRLYDTYPKSIFRCDAFRYYYQVGAIANMGILPQWSNRDMQI